MQYEISVQILFIVNIDTLQQWSKDESSRYLYSTKELKITVQIKFSLTVSQMHCHTINNVMYSQTFIECAVLIFVCNFKFQVLISKFLYLNLCQLSQCKIFTAHSKEFSLLHLQFYISYQLMLMCILKTKLFIKMIINSLVKIFNEDKCAYQLLITKCSRNGSVKIWLKYRKKLMNINHAWICRVT